MDYSFLQNYTSLIEIITAIYVSMFLEEILINIWTPNYKDEISNLIKKMNIPAINYFVAKVEKNIDDNDSTIAFYQRNGYEVKYEFTAYPKREMIRYIKELQ